VGRRTGPLVGPVCLSAGRSPCHVSLMIALILIRESEEEWVSNMIVTEQLFFFLLRNQPWCRNLFFLFHVLCFFTVIIVLLSSILCWLLISRIRAIDFASQFHP
jgi:hypothetical protein